MNYLVAIRALVFMGYPTCSDDNSPCVSAICCEYNAGYERLYSDAAPKSQAFEFQAQTKNLLDIVAKSLYSEHEVFVRELISNANDALEKRRYHELSAGTSEEKPLEVRITTDAANRKLVFEDTGIGMNREELINLLGTIAKSGSKEFREAKDDESVKSIIGQFGVGFYSAFMVAEKVVVKTRKHGESKGYAWTWNGGSTYEIEDLPEADYGTRIELSIRPGDAERFLKPEIVTDVVNKYSYFVTVPIYVNGERINTMDAIWTMNTSEVTPEMHETFFKQLTKVHHPHLAYDRPQYVIHYKTDAPVNLRALLYIPTRKVSQLEFAAEVQESSVSLYARRVLIKSHAKDLLPRYLRFLVGVVDSEDIPLNLSREMLQKDAVVMKIRRVLADKVVKFFVQQMKKDRVKYNEFYQGYSLFFKEGVVIEQDHTLKEEIAKMLQFESSGFKPGMTTSLQEYVERMQTEQKEIYYLFAPNRHLAETSPYYEKIKSQNKEVIFVYDPADELVFLSMPQFQMKHITSVEQWVKSEGLLESDKEDKEIVRDVNKKDLLDWIKTNLGSVKVSEIKPSAQRSDHPFMITVTGDLGAARHLLRIGQIKDMEHLVLLKPVLHVNFNHPVVNGLMKLRKQNEELARTVTEQVYDNALVTAGLLRDSSGMVSRINKILGDLMQAEKSSILTP
ncbi:Hsp90 protein [Aphelenchoides avenae]|nr:Hsp90 protein [Aphelenchus avenae]